MPQDSIQIRVSGRKLAPTLPALLRPAARSDAQGVDEFLPPGYLTPTTTFNVGASARSASDSVVDSRHDAREDEIVVLELADGSTFVTSAERLRASLAQTRPDLLGPNGEILLEKLRAESGAARGIFSEAIGGLIAKVFTFVVGGQTSDIIEATKDEVADAAQLGFSWLGTKALMRAIENKLKPGPGLYRWSGASGSATDFKKPEALPVFESPAEAAKKPMLVFVHGTGSSTLGSFGHLRAAGPDLWAALEQQYPENIYAFEHRTLSESPITNALELAEALPKYAHVSLVSHSRGGLVADLLCLGDFDALIDRYKFGFEGIGDAGIEDPRHARKRLRVSSRSSTQRTTSTAPSCASLPPSCATSWSRCSATCAPPALPTAPSSRAATSTSSSPESAHPHRPGAVLLRQPVLLGVQARGDRNREEPHQCASRARHRSHAARLADGAAAARCAGAKRHPDGGDRRRHRGRQPAQAAGRAADRLPVLRKRGNDLVVDTAAMLAGVAAEGRRARAVRPRCRRVALPLLCQPRHARRAAQLARRRQACGT